MLQVESDYLGSDWSLNMKAINPNPIENNGIYTVSGLQSVSQRLALGAELISQTSADSKHGNFDHGLNLAAKYTPTPSSTLTVSLQQFVALQSSYHHRVSDKVELASEVQMLLVGPRKDSFSSVSAKLEYRQATLRAQLDSLGRVGLVMEEKLFPGFALQISGEIDHVKNTSRFGVGINMEN
jgi:mitochondrial import receptor subunit TOM40